MTLPQPRFVMYIPYPSRGVYRDIAQTRGEIIVHTDESVVQYIQKEKRIVMKICKKCVVVYHTTTHINKKGSDYSLPCLL